MRSEKEWESWEFPLESALQEYCRKRITKYSENITLIKVVKANINGVSDLILCVNGKYVAIELKIGGNTPTEHQKAFVKQVIKSGGIGGIAWDWGTVKQYIRYAGFDIDTGQIING